MFITAGPGSYGCLDSKAKEVILEIADNAKRHKVVDITCEFYNTALSLTDLTSIPPLRLSRDDQKRALFEFVAFSAFSTYVVAWSFIRHGKMEASEPDLGGCRAFLDSLLRHMESLCWREGWQKVREVAVVPNGPPPGLRCQPGDYLNPLERFREYMQAEGEQQGSSAACFVERMAKALDAANFGIGGMVLGQSALPNTALSLAIDSMQGAFGPSAAQVGA